MTPSSASNSFYSAHDEIAFDKERKRQREAHVDEVTVDSPRFLFRLGREPIELSLIEFRIIDFLSQKPYKAFTRTQIVNSIRSTKCHLNEATLDEHIRTLRDKLGIFSDFIQSVPYIGYRFKP